MTRIDIATARDIRNNLATEVRENEQQITEAAARAAADTTTLPTAGRVAERLQAKNFVLTSTLSLLQSYLDGQTATIPVKGLLMAAVYRATTQPLDSLEAAKGSNDGLLMVLSLLPQH